MFYFNHNGVRYISYSDGKIIEEKDVYGNYGNWRGRSITDQSVISERDRVYKKSIDEAEYL